MFKCALGLVYALALHSAAAAQEGSEVAINQMNGDLPNQRAMTAAAQVDPFSRPVLPSVAPLSDTQIARPEARPSSGTPTAQVTSERGQAYFKLDLNVVEPSAEAPTSPTRRSEGRDTSAIVPSGPDRCDPQLKPQPARCDRVIEARAGEFQSPDHQPLSAEQRLLATQRELRPLASDLSAATRRLGNGELDDSSMELAAASVALRGSTVQPEAEAVASEPPAIDAIVAGITTLVTGLPPSP